jgi:hypothetical protein
MDVTDIGVLLLLGLRDFWFEPCQHRNNASQEINDAVLMLVYTTECTALDSVYVAVFGKL